MAKLKMFLKEVLPAPIWGFLQKMKAILLSNWKDFLLTISFFNWKDFLLTISFLSKHSSNVSLKDKMCILKQFYVINLNVSQMHRKHTLDEMLTVIRTIHSLRSEGNGIVVEAGCFKGISTAKFSIAADIVGRRLVVFDSFEGIPENDEYPDKTIDRGRIKFPKGSYCGTLEEVKANVTRFGKIDSCRFIKGWFKDTMPDFKKSISVIYLDVDLASSTRTCLKYLFPLLEKGGTLFSQDGHIPLVVDVFSDDNFWLKEVGCAKPSIQILGRKLIKILKEA